MLIRMFFKRFFRRLKHAFRWHHMSTWEYESCERCGSCFKLAYQIRDEIWLGVMGSENGCLCLNCLIELAMQKGVKLTKEDLDWLSIFAMPEYNEDILDFGWRINND